MAFSKNSVPFITQTGFGFKELSVYGDDYPTADGTAVRFMLYLVKAHVVALQTIKNKKRIPKWKPSIWEQEREALYRSDQAFEK
jgi:UDP-glucose 4-epimerase